MDLSKFEMLEGRVNALLSRLADLTSQNETLTSELAKAKEELDGAETRILTMEEERETILAKVDGLLSRLA